MSAKPRLSVLFVCLGNICRSPLAEGVFRAVLDERGLADAVDVDSAGTGGWHEGSGPDPRSIAVARRHGVGIAGQLARKVRKEDFERFALILGMDASNVETLRRRAPEAARERVHLFMAHAGYAMVDVPDPYFGGPDGFETIYRMIREASEALADTFAARLSSLPRSGQASSTM